MTEPRWIEIEDRLPDHNQIVLCYDKYSNFISLGKYSDDDDGFFELMSIERIEIDSEPTHWMPLPSTDSIG